MAIVNGPIGLSEGLPVFTAPPETLESKIERLKTENEKLKQQLELAEKQQDTLYEKIEDFRELVTLLMKVW